MSEALRSLHVGIQFDDGASKTIAKIDDKMDGLERGFIKFGAKVDKSGTSLQSMGSVGINSANQIASGFNRTERELTGFNKELDESHSDLRTMGSIGVNSNNQIERGFNESEREARGFNRAVKNSGDALGGLKKMAAGLGGVIAGAFAVDKIKDFATSGIELAAGTKALNSQFGQVFGLMELTAEAKLNNIANQTGILPDRLKGSFSQIAAFAKTTGAETEEAMSLAERATLAAADSAAYQDRSIEDVTENLRSLLKGNFENDAALGISVTETTRNTKAMEMFNKKFKDLNELQKQDALLSMVEDSHKVTGAIGQAAREADGLENVTGNLNSAWNGLKGTMMTPFLEPLTDGMVSLTKKMQGIDAEEIGMKMKSGFDLAKETIMSFVYDTGEVSDLWQNAGFSKENSDTIAEFGGLLRTSVVGGIKVAKAAFEGFKTTLHWAVENKDTLISLGSGLAAGFATFKAIQIGKGVFDMVKSFSLIGSLTNPVGIAVVAIGGLVAGFVWLRNNSDMLMEKWETMKSNTSSAWAQIKDDVGGAVEQVGGFFTGLKDKAVGLWETIKQNPMLLSVVGPIGMVVGAGMELYQNWDSIKGKAVELWTTTTEKFAGIKQSVSDFVEPAIGWFDTLGQKWDDFKSSLLNFEMPAWVSTVGDTIGGATSKVKSWVTGGPDGSHATGLANVGWDGYRAELHRGESVLTASQSDTLRGMGILSSNSDGTPNLNLDSVSNIGSSDSTTASYGSPAGNRSRPPVNLENHFIFHITGGNAEEIIAKVKTVIPNLIRNTVSDMMDEELQTL